MVFQSGPEKCMNRLISLLLGLMISLTTSAQGFDRPVGEPFASRSEIIAPHGMVATSQPLATQVALDILKAAVTCLRSSGMRKKVS